MTNDAKLGMLAGVLGVIVAAVFFANSPPGASPGPAARESPATPVAQPAAPPASAAHARPPPETNTAALPATPIPRTRNDVDAQPASRQGGADEEP